MRTHSHIWRSLTILTLAAALCLAAYQGAASTASTTDSATTGSITSTGSLPGQPTGTARPTSTSTPAPTATLAPEPTSNIPAGHFIFLGADGIYAVDTSSQLLAWADHNNHSNTYSFLPLICRGQIITLIGPATPTLQSLSPRTGALVWSAHVANQIPVGCDSNHIYASLNNNLTAYDYTTGAKAWDLSGISDGSVLGNGLIFSDIASGEMLAIDAATGATHWTFGPGPNDYGYGFAASANVVFAVARDDIVHALATSDGHELWHTTVAQAETLSYDDNIVFVSTFADNLVALSATDGHQLWQLSTHNHSPGLPTVANGVAYLAASDNHFYAVNEQTGALIWKMSPPAGFIYATQPIMVDNILFYLHGNSGTQQILGINPQSRTVLWAYSTSSGVGQLQFIGT